MIRPSLPAALCAIFIGFGLLPAQAETKDCTLANNYCVPIVGCIAASGETFTGMTHGQRKGPLNIASSTGAECVGTWRRTAFGGKARIACSDGRTATLKFNYFNAQTGTVGGAATLSSGEIAEVFSGHRISAFLKSNAKIRGKSPACTALVRKLL